MHLACFTLCYSPDQHCLRTFYLFLTFKIKKMPLVSALRAWLAMVPAIALAPDTRLEIAAIDGRLDVIETKKPKKVS